MLERTAAERGPQRSQHGSGIDGTHLVYFYVPLPEPLALPDGYIIECSVPAPLEWTIQQNREFGETPPSRLLDASLCFHRSTSRAGIGQEMLELFQAASKATNNTSRTRWRRIRRTARIQREYAERTIVEMVVPVSISPIDSEKPNEGREDHYPEFATEAFDRGLGYIRDVQRSYYLATRRPLHLVTRTMLPFAVPMAQRKLDGDSGPGPMDFSMFMVNENLWRDVRDEELDDSALERLSVAMREQGEGGVAARYLEFVREGGVALDLDGDTRAAAMFLATASEVLLDESLAHLLWESGMRPEEAALLLDEHPWLTGRVKSLYHPRIGGVWNVRTLGPVNSWFVHVAGLRNRVVHAGYEPALNECKVARESVLALQQFVADRVCERLPTYPRTAMAMVGRPGLESRGLWNETMEALVRSASEVPWRQTFVRWRTAMHRSRQDSETYTEPRPDESVVAAVLHPSGQVVWVAHDPTAGLASRISRDDVLSTEQQFEVVDAHFAALVDEPVAETISTALTGATIQSTAAFTWVPEYRLLPLTGVMVNGQDLDPIPSA